MSPSEAASSGAERILVPQFTGGTAEYFRIWIVNLLYTFLTLGIFSAWAKVRKKKYFYGNTRFDGDSFDYTAQPMAILKGRLVAGAVVVVYFLTSEVVAGSQVWFWLAGAIALPWLATRALLFNARNSAWRGIRFDFRADARDAARYFVPRLLVVPLTLGLAIPWLQARARQWMMRQYAHGDTACECEIPVRAYYSTYIRSAGLMMLLGMLVGLASFALTGLARDRIAGLPDDWQWLGIAMPAVLVYLIYAAAWAYVTSRTTNLAWSGTTLGNLRFKSIIRARTLAGLYLVNILAIIASLGLAVPWATLRTYRYRLSCLSASAIGAIEHRAAPGQVPIGATGQELGDLFNVDFGL